MGLLRLATQDPSTISERLPHLSELPDHDKNMAWLWKTGSRIITSCVERAGDQGAEAAIEELKGSSQAFPNPQPQASST
ncbi:hypothetical protein WJX74_007070 [Apatococcus lobatus]|uniref:Uncharacterized protein n=1 Tax=Apatococcus lobatus TaxID=904363 RepID=A0AAW1QDQ7_9CHLO